MLATAAARLNQAEFVEQGQKLLEETYGRDRPTDARFAEAGNRERPGVLDADLVRALRTGAQTDASDDVLDALARALDASPVFFRSDSAEVAQVVAAVRAAQAGLTVMAARGAGEDGLPAELLDFVTDTFAGILDPDPPGGR
ncbi:hypothetical protein [Streptomyces sp. NPDC001889]